MFIKLGVILILLRVLTAQEENHNWDLAVAADGKVQLLTLNGSLVGFTDTFSTLKAITFDNIRHTFVVSDVEVDNDTIYSLPLQKEGINYPIIQDVLDDIQGLAIDPIDDVLYWTNTLNHTINYKNLSDPYDEPHVFMNLEDEIPQDIVIDSCRRYIYWTNSNTYKPTIDRASLIDKKHEILVNTNLNVPAGIAIDYISQKIYWANMGPGIYYTIESTNLNGTEREIVFEGTHQLPFSVAVDEDAIYWTDINNNALWRIRKKFHEKPNKLRDFKEKPMGLIAKHLGFAGTPDCTNIMEAIDKYNKSTTEFFEYVKEEYVEEDGGNRCLNNAEETENGCVCQRGFSGSRCEIAMCHNYCVHGDCYHSKLGYPQCRCPTGFTGSRCERSSCDGLCLNGGTCTHNKSYTWGANCNCPEGFMGDRCEINLDIVQLCNMFCKEDSKQTFIDCRCLLLNSQNFTQFEEESTETNEHVSFFEHLEDKAFLVVSICMLVSMLITVGLLIVTFRLRKRRPRINKRIIVNKNVTPLTYRPQPTSEQCEITIENCCNMNVCETPCFEPPQLRKKNAKDEKKMLLTNMENGDDLY